MPATVRPPPDKPHPAVAATASPYGLSLRDDPRNTFLTAQTSCDPCPDSPATYHLRHTS